ncbi:X-box-binding protein 1-like isoform X2 [Limulus polyphemus]|nr:X-box-binding protein 1-like isoform X2 [Limulus polyphemus]
MLVVDQDIIEPKSVENAQSAAITRKRQRLDHLSFEEKIMRRKLKNRVAAQSARDRKKARLSELEIVVKDLEEEKVTLLSENKSLKQKLTLLENENLDLKSRLGLRQVKLKQEDQEKKCIVEGKDLSGSLKHASLINGPLQKEQDLLISILLMMQYVFLPVMISLMNFLTCFSSTVKSYSSVILSQKIQFHSALNLCRIKEANPAVKWWGPHQKSWNPSKN